MPPDEQDLACILDMYAAAGKILRITQNLTREAYDSDEVVRLAIERLIEIIGEAARSVSDEGMAAYSEIPWRKIIAQRHVLAHDYGEIQHDLIWQLVTDKIPELQMQLESILREEGIDE